MASPRKDASDPPSDPVLAPVPADKPKLVVTHGRGGTGKSTFVRVMVERAREAGTRSRGG